MNVFTKLFSVLCVFLVSACGPIQAQYYESMPPRERLANMNTKTDQELCNAFTNGLVGPETRAAAEKILIERNISQCHGKTGNFAYVGDGAEKAKKYAAKKWSSLRDVTASEKAAMISAVKDVLKDPASAKFKWPPIYPNAEVYCGFVNAKNSYGGYTGDELYYLAFHRTGGRLVPDGVSMSVHDIARCPKF